MKKIVLVFMVIVSVGLCGCSMNNEKEEQKTAAESAQNNSEEAEPDNLMESSAAPKDATDNSPSVPEEEQDAGNENDDGVYEQYNGYWSCEGKTHEQNVKEPDNGSDYGIGGSYELIREKENTDEGNAEAYPAYEPSWMEEEMVAALEERSGYYRASAYYSEILYYWENVREVRDVTNRIEPLFETDKKYYTKEEFEKEPMLVIHLAKNEIYARHGYIFKNEDLYNYFMGCIWYSPTCNRQDFKDSVFNEYEKANLELLDELDTY